MASHEYLGTRAARAVRKWAKLTRGQPEPVALDRIDLLLRGLPEAPTVGGTARPFNPPRLAKGGNGK